MMRPVITSIKAEVRSKRLDRRQCCWHVSYQFCGLSAEITVYAENEAEARAAPPPWSVEEGMSPAIMIVCNHRELYAAQVCVNELPGG